MKSLGRAFATLAGVAILFMMAVTSIDVVGRFFFNTPLKGAFEMTEITMALVIFAGLSLAALSREHITVNLFESRTPKWARRWQVVAGDIVCAAVVAVMGWRILERGSALVASRETTLVLGVMRGHVAWAMAALCAVAVLVFLYCAWRDARKPRDATEEVHVGAL